MMLCAVCDGTRMVPASTANTMCPACWPPSAADVDRYVPAILAAWEELGHSEWLPDLRRAQIAVHLVLSARGIVTRQGGDANGGSGERSELEPGPKDAPESSSEIVP